MAPKIATHVYTVTTVKLSHKDSFAEVKETRVFTKYIDAANHFENVVERGESEGVVSSDVSETLWAKVSGRYFEYHVKLEEHPILVDTEEHPIPLEYKGVES